jgi:type IV pilus assembly protein PilO
MKDFLQSILERPLSQRIGILVAVIGAVSFGFWSLFYSPKLTENAELSEKLESLEVSVANEQRLAMNLEKFRKEVKDLDVKLKFVLQELPDSKEIPELLTQISNLARDAGLEEGLFKTKPELYREFYAEVPIEISVLGTFHQVATFFDEVGNAPRIVNISQIDMREPKIKDSEVRVKVGCVATTFRYLDESERVKQVDKGQDKRKRKR